METQLNLELAKAVQYLRGKGIVHKDKDIAEKTGYGKASISNYVNGKMTASKEFIKKFETVYKLKLADFKPGGNKEEIDVPDGDQMVAESVIQIMATARTNQSLLVEVLANQTGKTVMELQRVVSDTMAVELKQILHELKVDGKRG